MRDFAPERRPGLAHLRQRDGQILFQVAQHPCAAGAVGVVEPLYVRERVEEEVRLDLRLEHLQLRLCGLLIHARRIDSALLQRGDVVRFGEYVQPRAGDDQAEQQKMHPVGTQSECSMAKGPRRVV